MEKINALEYMRSIKIIHNNMVYERIYLVRGITNNDLIIIIIPL